MPESPEPRDEALKRFDERYEAAAASHRRTPKVHDVEGGAGVGYRLIGELIGGMLTGLGLGWLLDRFAGTAPFGLIGGVLIGTGASIYMVVRSAGRMTSATHARPAATAAPPVVEDEDGPG